jgi:hypothetical protein
MFSSYAVGLTHIFATTIATLLLSAPAISLPSHEATLIDFQRTFEARRRRAGEGIRRGLVCPLAPGIQEFVLWSDRPRFLWQVDPNGVEAQSIRLLTSGDEVVWEKTLARDSQTIVYDGVPLQPGQTYTWELSVKHQESKQSDVKLPTPYRFQVMEANQRNQIAAELEKHTLSLKQPDASPELIALVKANYLTEKRLLSDALQVLYAVPAPSPQLRGMLEKLTREACTLSIKKEPERHQAINYEIK